MKKLFDSTHLRLRHAQINDRTFRAGDSDVDDIVVLVTQ